MYAAIAIGLLILVAAITIPGANFLYYFVVSTPASFLLYQALKK